MEQRAAREGERWGGGCPAEARAWERPVHLRQRQPDLLADQAGLDRRVPHRPQPSRPRRRGADVQTERGADAAEVVGGSADAVGRRAPALRADVRTRTDVIRRKESNGYDSIERAPYLYWRPDCAA